MRIEEVVRQVAQEYPHKTAIVFDGKAITYAELDKQGRIFGMELLRAAKGLPVSDVGSKILVLSKNSIDCITAFLGCFNAGFTACPINWRLSPKELACVLAREHFALAVVGEEFVESFRKARALCKSGMDYVVLEEAANHSQTAASSGDLAGGNSSSEFEIFRTPVATSGGGGSYTVFHQRNNGRSQGCASYA